MKVLITGGSGFIAEYFHRDLGEQGHELVTLDLVEPNPDHPAARSPFARGDVRDPNALDAAMEGCDRAGVRRDRLMENSRSGITRPALMRDPDSSGRPQQLQTGVAGSDAWSGAGAGNTVRARVFAACVWC